MHPSVALLVLLATALAARGQVVTFAGNAQHTGIYTTPAQPLNQVRWSTKISLTSFLTDAHYGAPLITASNTVVVPVRNSSGFLIWVFDGSTGRLKYTLNTDYLLPSYSWLPPYQPVLATPPSGTRLYYAGAGGTVYYIENLDSDTPSAPVQQCFYTDMGSYRSNAAAFNSKVFINTPLTAGPDGAVFFGFNIQAGAAPPPLSTANGGFARLAPDGTGIYVLANQAAADPRIVRPPHGCAPALSNDGTTLYVAARASNNDYFNGSQYCYLLGLDSATLLTNYRVLLQPQYVVAYESDNVTASPVIGPDGDVFFGVFTESYRGLLLHYSADLSIQMTPGSFGWDNTPAIVPASLVPGYTGPSTYLLFSKYNSYADGLNKLALLDPNAAQIDPIDNFPTMREVLTVLGPTPDPTLPTFGPYAVREWCINAAAVNPVNHCVFMPNEDGHLYRWDLASNSLSAVLALGPSVSEGYVPTVIGPDGTVYTLSNNKLYACGGLSNLAVAVYSSSPDLRSVVAGQSVTFTAVVTNLDPLGPAPTGSVTFSDLTYRGVSATNAVLAANVPLSNGLASVTTAALAAGSNYLGNHFISAVYSGDAHFRATNTLVQKIHASATTTTLVPAVINSFSVLLTATVAPTPVTANVPTGLVAFWDGANLLAQLPLNSHGVASTNWSFTPGSHACTASYSSDTVFAGSSGAPAITPASLAGSLDPATGAMVITFTNSPGLAFEMLSAADVSLPRANWLPLGPVTEISPGLYQFVDSQPALAPAEFYQARTP